MLSIFYGYPVFGTSEHSFWEQSRSLRKSQSGSVHRQGMRIDPQSPPLGRRLLPARGACGYKPPVSETRTRWRSSEPLHTPTDRVPALNRPAIGRGREGGLPEPAILPSDTTDLSRHRRPGRVVPALTGELSWVGSVRVDHEDLSVIARVRQAGTVW